ncbi:MAG: M20/M25/M40 family metallo-hydrolase [Opitutus sp.]|nr:M20/M25/M40 family metallo-hydrolase [Opitutus sp.]
MGARFFAAILVLGVAVGAQPPSATDDARAQRIISSPAFKAAVAVFERDFDRFVDEIVLLTEIPAPPFGEKARGEAYLKMLRATGLEQCETDTAGNVMGLRRGQGRAPLLAVAAHLDTVFPAGTEVKVKRVGTTLRAPGVGDDTRSLAFLLAALRAMREAKIETAGDILFIGDVGEEGAGDLRGMRYLFGEGPWKGKIKRFITVDGTSNDVVTNGALGSLRYRVTFKGPGGHSWGAFGQVSPAFAMGNAIAQLGKLVVPRSPKVSYNVGMVTGGTSVNSIPFEVAMEVDLRSTAPDELKKVDARFKEIVAAAVAEENAARATTFGRITADVQLIGDRPSGVLPPKSPELRQVAATMAAYDKAPVWTASSTDANIPIGLGIPAFALAAQSANRGARSHSLDEWTDVEKTTAVKDFSLALAILLTVAELP